MLCGVRFSRSTLFWYSLFQNRKKVSANQAKFLLVPLMICQITHCKRAASRRREAVRRQPNRAVRESSKAEKISNPPYIVM